MPHIVVKLIEGRPEEKKQELAEKMAALASETLGIRPGAFSVHFEEVSKSDWMDGVYKAEIKPNFASLRVKPDYSDEA